MRASFVLAALGLQSTANVFVDAHGYLNTPRSRNVYAHDEGPTCSGSGCPPAEYCHHCLNLNDGVCGKFGSRAYESSSWLDKNGAAMPWLPQEEYVEGQTILIKSYLDTHHNGHMEIRACNKGPDCTQADFEGNHLIFVKDTVFAGNHIAMPADPNYPERGMYAGGQGGGTKWFEFAYKLPDGMHGDRVMLQWKYITANSCSPPGYKEYFQRNPSLPNSYWTPGLVTCNLPYPIDGTRGTYWPEQFFNCAEVKIIPSTSPQSPKPTYKPTPPTIPIPTGPPALPGSAFPVNKSDYVRVNQIGYLRFATKIGVVVDRSVSPIQWQIQSGGAVVFSGLTKVYGYDDASGDHVHHCDFSSLSDLGSYRLVVAGVGSSLQFNIAPSLYPDLPHEAMNYFYFHRMGNDIIGKHLIDSRYARAALHPGDSSVPPYPGWCRTCKNFDLRGSWADAGDFGIYTVNHAISAWTLLNLHELFPEAFVDGDLNLPESGNSFPDVLDEVDYGSRFIRGMLPSDGGLASHKAHNHAWSAFTITVDGENSMQNARSAMGSSTAATYAVARVNAQLARMWSAKGGDSDYVALLWDAAVDAWSRADGTNKVYRASEASPGSGSGGGDYPDSQIDDDRYAAACEMYLTALAFGDSSMQAYKDAMMTSPHYTHVSQFDWATVTGTGTLSLYAVENDLSSQDKLLIEKSIVSFADRVKLAIDSEGYPSNLNFPSEFGQYPWGSNSFIINRAIVLAYAYEITGNDSYQKYILRTMDYIMGVNAMHISYVTGYGDKSETDTHDRWAWTVGQAKFWPKGWLSGGPNSELINDYETPSGVAAAKSYAGPGTAPSAWASKENTINWNAPLAWVGWYIENKIVPNLGGCDSNCGITCAEAGSFTIPGSIIQAEEYCEHFGTQLENTNDAGGGSNIGFLDAGDFTQYNIAVNQTGQYILEARVASQYDSGRIDVQVDGKSVVVLNVPNTNGWQSWTTISTALSISQGTHQLRLSYPSGNFNLNWISFTAKGCSLAPSFAVPGIIEAESFCDQYGVKLETTSDAGGGQNIGFIDSGDYVEYNIQVETAGQYDFEARVASEWDTGKINVKVDGSSLAMLTVPNTGGWQSFITLKTQFSLSSGSHRMRLEFPGQGFNINWLRFVSRTTVSNPPTATKKPTLKPTSSPTKRPSAYPTKKPTQKPTERPSTPKPTLKPTLKPTTKAPSPTLRPTNKPTEKPSSVTSFCGCNSCTRQVWDAVATDAGGTYSCGARIQWLQTSNGGSMSEREACVRVAGVEFPNGPCGPYCDPNVCNIVATASPTKAPVVSGMSGVFRRVPSL